jgi:mRNA interferase MazF
MRFPRRGEVFLVSPDPTVGTQIGKTRPAVIISNDTGNQYSDRVIVAPTTTRRVANVFPFEVLVPSGEGGLVHTSKVVLDQLRSVDKTRLQRRLGALPAHRILEVDQAIRLSLAV